MKTLNTKSKVKDLIDAIEEHREKNDGSFNPFQFMHERYLIVGVPTTPEHLNQLCSLKALLLEWERAISRSDFFNPFIEHKALLEYLDFLAKLK
jgi:hypothetical protein